MVKIIDPVTKIEWNYSVDKRMKRFLDKRKESLTAKDEDYVMLIDGYEGCGKSTLAQQIGRYVDHSLDLDRVCMTAEEFKEAIRSSQKNQCVIYDEAVTGLSAGDSITRIGKLLKSMMMQMRQKNLFVIIILPTVFELNRYAVLHRARCLFHVYKKGETKGYWVGYNKKSLKYLYIKGKKYMSYCVRSFFNGRFYGKYTVDEALYRKKKEDALYEAEDGEKFNRYRIHRDQLIKYIYLKEGLSFQNLVIFFKEQGVDIKRGVIQEVCKGLKGNNR